MTVQEWLGEDNKLGIDIWERKYRYQDETFDEWLDRVSGGNEDVRNLIVEKKFLFGGRILANRGLDKRGVKVSLSNCYVLKKVGDSLEEIFDCAAKMARTFSYGGGVGIDISNLSPRGAVVNNAAKETSGAVSFMDLYSMVTGLIGQSGRRGALMISIACDHPDVEEFIEIKNDLNRVTKANISVRVTNKFMEAVERDLDFKLSFTREETGQVIEKNIKARELFHKICENNWNMAEPGLLFWDTIENYNLLSEDKNFHYEGVNPCAEEPLPAGGSCSLSAINLSEFVTNNKEFDIKEFCRVVDIAVRAQNDILDEGLLLHPLKEQQQSVSDWRQIGVGIFGLADMLIKMGITYGNPYSLTLCDLIGYTMASEAIKTSIQLAKEKGKYPMFSKDVFKSQFFINHWDFDSETISNAQRFGLRNSQLLTIAPTGSLSTMLGVSGGIEPIFANYYTRKTESLHNHDEYYKVYTPIVEKYMKENKITDDTMLPEYFITARDLDYRNRIAMQSVWQKHIDASISSTINVPNSFTVKDVEDLYMMAWRNGLKGVTIFRDGCKRAAVLSTSSDNTVNNSSDNNTKDNDKEKTVNTEDQQNDKSHNWDKNNQDNLERGKIIATNDNIIGLKRKLMTGCGSLHCQAFFDPNNGELREIYLSKGSTGGCLNFMTGLSRMISAAARAGVSTDDIVDQLMSTGACPSYAKRGKSKGSCCPMAVGYALKDMQKQFMGFIKSNAYENKTDEKNPNKNDSHLDNNKKSNSSNKETAKCPECGEELIFAGGCNICRSCGWSKCD